MPWEPLAPKAKSGKEPRIDLLLPDEIDEHPASKSDEEDVRIDAVAQRALVAGLVAWVAPDALVTAIARAAAITDPARIAAMVARLPRIPFLRAQLRRLAATPSRGRSRSCDSPRPSRSRAGTAHPAGGHQPAGPRLHQPA